MRNLKHISLRYVRNRSLVWLYEKQNPEAPWITREMRFILEDLLKPTDCGIEWGSGRSTAWFAKRVGRLTSIEDNKEWFERVRVMLIEKGLEGKVDYRLRPEGESYPAVADEIPDDSLDFALVDGQLRNQCALRILPKIKPSGLLVVDNANWFLPSPRGTHSPSALSQTDREWESINRRLAIWRCIWTSNGVTDTALWIKPLNS